jgi:hypothetical protein
MPAARDSRGRHQPAQVSQLLSRQLVSMTLLPYGPTPFGTGTSEAL